MLCFAGAFVAGSAQAGSRTVIASLSALPEPSLYEANIEFLVTLTVPMGAAAPTGTVAFAVDGVPAGSPQPVQNNMAEYFVNTPGYSIGAHTVTAMYSGDTNYDPVIVTTQHTVAKLRSQMGLNVTTPLVYYGQTADAVGQVTQVDNAPDATLNGGTITFLLDGNDICDLQVTGQQETCPASAGQNIDAGAHVLVAVYSGNQYYTASASPGGSFTVLPDDTTESLTSNLNPSIYGQNVTFTSVLSAPFAIPGGPVVFYDGATSIGTANLNASGVASVSVSTLIVGTHQISAVYSKTRNFNGSSSPIVKQVVILPAPAPVNTVTLLNSSLNPSVVGQSVTFTAAVATTGAFVQTPSGTVTFLDGATVLGTATVDANGDASLTTSMLSAGQHPVVAKYASTQAFGASSSATLLQIVNNPLTSAGNGFLLTVTPAALGIGVGSYVSVSVNVLALNGFNQPVQLSCANAPAEMNCIFDVKTIPAGGGTTRLTLHPAAPHDCGSDTPYFTAAGKASVLPVFAVAVLLCFPGKRRRWAKLLAATALLAVLPLIGGCGHCTDLGVKPGTYTFNIQGSSMGAASVTHAVSMNVNVHL